MSDKKKHFIVAQVPSVIKEDFTKMCIQKGYKESEYIRHLLRRDVQKWKEEKAA